MEAWREYLIKISTGKDVKKSREVCICLTESENEEEMIYQVYTVLLNQLGGVAPTAIVLQDTLGGSPVYSYDAQGSYSLTNTGKFIAGKTFIFIRSLESAAGDFGNSRFMFDYELISNDEINIYSADGTATLTDGILNNTEFEIRVYP